MSDFLIILSAACLIWGLGAALVVAICDEDGRIAHLLSLLRHLGGTDAR